MHVTRIGHARDFLDRALPQLERNEAANNLMIGIAGRLCEDSTAYSDLPPYFAVVEDAVGEEAGEDEFAAVALMTSPYSLVLHSDSARLEPALRLLATDLMESDWEVPGVNGPTELAHAFANIWTELNGCSYRVEMKLRTFELRRVDHPRYSAGRLRAATSDELALVLEWVQSFTEEALGDIESFDVARARARYSDAIEKGTIFFWDDEGPVSMAGTGRQTAHGTNIGLVYTPPDRRGRGYAGSCVAALSQKLLDEDRDFCTLFTDLANPTSNRIYQRIGYRPVCDYAHLRFE